MEMDLEQIDDDDDGGGGGIWADGKLVLHYRVGLDRELAKNSVYFHSLKEITVTDRSL